MVDTMAEVIGEALGGLFSTKSGCFKFVLWCVVAFGISYLIYKFA